MLEAVNRVFRAGAYTFAMDGWPFRRFSLHGLDF